MDIPGPFEMPAPPRQAVELQRHLRGLVVPRGRARAQVVAGVDIGYKNGIARAAIMLLRGLGRVKEVVAEEPISYPCVPGLLSFRGIPPLLDAWKQLRTRPDIVIVDDPGLAHPRRLGVASHFEVLIGLPTVGCAKSRLTGTSEEPAPERGSWSPLRSRGERIGAALRARNGTNVVYVPIVQLINLRHAISVVLACASRYRLPEPQRLADQLTRSP